MSHTMLANSTDLDHWADRIESRSTAPRLLRRLIHATCQDVQRIGFPADEGVQLGGWDGIVLSVAGNAYVPGGVSVWEVGATKDIKGKANDDYEKRSQNPLDVIPDETTFVFVTPRRWGGKDDWVHERNNDGIWHEVKAYDAEDLAQWLEEASAVHVWLSELIGKRPVGMRSLDDFWDTWSNETRPPLPPALVVGGRTKERDTILTWLQSEASPLTLAGDSATEAIAFLASVIEEADSEKRAIFLSRAVVADSAEAWYSLGPSSAPLILIPKFSDPEGVGKVVSQGHHVFVPLDRAAAAGATVLPRLVRASAEQALLAAGVKSDRAGDLATLARVSLSGLRRTIAVAPGLLAPSWARPEVAQELLAPLLAGVWQDNATGDRAVLASLSGMDYEKFHSILVRKMNEPEPALRQTAEICMITGRADAWQRLLPYVTEKELKTFESVFLDVMSEIDPASELPLNRRYLSSFFGKSRVHSGHLRNGLAEMLLIMAALSPSTTIANISNGEDFAGRVVRSLLAKAKGQVEIWASFSYQLPTLAEAAPNVFLDAVSEGLTGETPSLIGLFQDQEHGLFGSSPHTGLLWALETLAWNSDHFGRAVLSLAILARLDPGGKMGNRPASSLRDIFLCWNPNTTVSLKRRLAVLDAMRKREPEVSWRLMMKLLPRTHSHVTPTHKPQWREWILEAAEAVTVSEYIEATDGVLDRLLSDAGAITERWSELIEASGEMTPSQREKLLNQLDALDEQLFSSEERANVQNILRSIIWKHREFPDADWSMPEEDTDRLEQIYKKFEPEDVVIQARWLFKRWIEISGIRRMEWEKRDQAVKDMRVTALKAIHQSEDWSGLLRLAAQVEDAHAIGIMLLQAGLSPKSETLSLLELMSSDNVGLRMMAQGFILASEMQKGNYWVEQRLADMQDWPAEQIANFLLCLPFTPSLLDKLEATTESVRKFFWKNLRSASLFDDDSETDRAITTLLAFDRPDLAMEAVERGPSTRTEFLAPERIADILEAYVQSPSISSFNSSSLVYQSSELLDYLEKSNLARERVARLEWMYLPIHEHHRQPRLLHEEMARDPHFFIEVLNQAYPGPVANDEEGEAEMEVSAEIVARATMAHTLLDSWHQIPGKQEDTISQPILQQWVETVRQLAATNNNLKLVDSVFSKVFAFSPADTDGAWPHVAIREIIEHLSNPDVEESWIIGVLNSRGVTSRGLTDGGQQERALADKYKGYAELIEDVWPRTAAALRRPKKTIVEWQYEKMIVLN